MSAPHRRQPVCDTLLAWCTTDHASAAHPEDDDHRSEGLGVDVTVRGHAGAATAGVLEVGLLQRRSDEQAWIVIEDGAANHLELTLDSARHLMRLIRADATLCAALGEPPEAEPPLRAW